MNKIWPLFDKKFVLDLFRRQVLPLYPGFKEITGVHIVPYKKMIWTTTYHVVVGFETRFIKDDGSAKTILIICSAHSEEPRANVFHVLNYLWANNFNNQRFGVPRPLFYSEEFRGVFYRGLRGENILSYIKNKNFALAEEKIILAAEIFARLHCLPVNPGPDFNADSARIETVIPGVPLILSEISARYGGVYDNDLKKVYDYFIAQENKFLAGRNDLCLIHGDAHLENIVDTGAGRVGMIDFSDLCRGDFARDLGTFLQQLEYKVLTKAGDEVMAEKLKAVFLKSYLAARKMVLSAEIEERIRFYYNWTAIRTAIYLLLKAETEPKRAIMLLEQVKSNIGIRNL
jgi:thiamine kinase-like enzyme